MPDKEVTDVITCTMEQLKHYLDTEAKNMTDYNNLQKYFEMCYVRAEKVKDALLEEREDILKVSTEEVYNEQLKNMYTLMQIIENKSIYLRKYIEEVKKK